MIEAKVNDVVTIDDKHYKVVEKNGDCSGCSAEFKHSFCSDLHNHYGMCSSRNRMDGKNIIYVEVK